MKKYRCFFPALAIVVFMFVLSGCAYDNGVVERPNDNGSISLGETDNPSTSVNNRVMPTPPSIASGGGDLNNGDQPLQPEFSPEPMSEYTSENAREPADITAEDFILTISVPKPTLTQAEAGRNFLAYVELKNQSSIDLDIAVDILFWPMIPNWARETIDMPSLRIIPFPQNGVIRQEPTYPFPLCSTRALDKPRPFGVGGGNWRIDNKPLMEMLPPVGTHELTFVARFLIVCEQGEETWQGETYRRIEIYSNIVTLTVEPTPESPHEPISRNTTITAEDFVLTISVEEPTLRYGDPAYKGFEVYAELKNQSGRDLEVIIYILFWPSIPNWSPSDVVDIAEPITILFPKDSVIRREPTARRDRPLDEPIPIGVGRCGYGRYNDLLPVGTHELRIGAVFYVVCEQGNENQWIGVSSNVVELTILP